MCARSSRFSIGRKYATPYTVPQKLIFISQRKSSSEISSNLPSSATPALLISSVTRPCFFLTSFANEHTAFSSATSKTCVVISAPFFSNDRAVCESPPSSMSASATPECAAANCCARPRPLPEPAPVTTATPADRKDISPRCADRQLAGPKDRCRPLISQFEGCHHREGTSQNQAIEA